MAKKTELTAEQKIANALSIIHQSGGVDGGHHKAWVLNQVVKALCGGKRLTDWEAEETPEYKKWVKEYEAGEDGPKTYEWDKGIAP